jgi:hypothetical protein
MGKVTFKDHIDYVQGKIGADTDTIFSYHRKFNQRRISKQGVRSTAFSDEEKARHEQFKQVRLATLQRLQDSDRNLADQIAFAAQSKYKTLYRFVFNQEWKAYTA